MYTGPVEPGSTPDLTAARLHVLPALYRSAWLGMPVLADKGYQGAGIGILVPTKNPCPTPDEEACNSLLSAMRAPAERANAEPVNEPFSPGGPLDWRGSARWCGKDWVGWGWCARGPVRDSVF